MNQAVDFLEKSGLKLFTAILVFIFGCMTINNIIRLVKEGLLRTKIETALVNLVLTVVKLSLYVALTLYCLGIMNIPMTGFVATLSALTLAIGLSIQNIISSVANSIVLVGVRPFKVGDFVEISGMSGTIKEINLIHTVINTPDNRRMVIPNSSVFNSTIINYSANDIRRIDIKISVDYDADTELARKVLLEVCQKHPMVLNLPAPQVRWNAHNDSYLEFCMRVWCAKDNYWPVTWDLDEQACKALQNNNICIPFPQITLSYREDASKVLSDAIHGTGAADEKKSKVMKTATKPVADRSKTKDNQEANKGSLDDDSDDDN